MKVKVGVSNRHIHLTQEDLSILFGGGYELTVRNTLTQPGEFACNESVTIKTPKRELTNVRIIGPVRKYTQVEISKTDSYSLGLNPPVRSSGDLENSENVTIIGPKGELEKKSVCIIANRHIHITPALRKEKGLENTSEVSVKIEGDKSGIIDHVHLKESDSYAFELHLDTDDANAFMLKSGDEVEILWK